MATTSDVSVALIILAVGGGARDFDRPFHFNFIASVPFLNKVERPYEIHKKAKTCTMNHIF